MSENTFEAFLVPKCRRIGCHRSYELMLELTCELDSEGRPEREAEEASK